MQAVSDFWLNSTSNFYPYRSFSRSSLPLRTDFRGGSGHTWSVVDGVSCKQTRPAIFQYVVFKRWWFLSSHGGKPGGVATSFAVYLIEIEKQLLFTASQKETKSFPGHFTS